VTFKSKMFKYWNCGSGLLGKVHIIHEQLKQLKPHAFFVSESDILNNKILGPFQYGSYKFENSLTITSRGKARLSCWFRPDLYSRSYDLELNNNEIIVLKSKSENLMIVGIYHAFKCFENETVRGNFFRLIDNLELISSMGGRIIIVGDFNVHYDETINCPLRLRLEEWANNFGYDQLITGITRVRKVLYTVQSSLIDLVFVNTPDVVVSTEFNNASDHVIISVLYEKGRKINYVKLNVDYLDWREYSPLGACELFLQFFPGISLTMSDPENINECITTSVCQMLNELVPKRNTTIRGSNPIVNPTIQNLKNKKSRLYKKWSRTRNLQDYENLRKISSKLNREIKNERNNKFKSRISISSKEYWSAVKSMIEGENAIKATHFKTPENMVVTGAENIANSFGRFFNEKVSHLLNECEVDNYIIPDLREIRGEGDLFNDNLFFSPMEIKEAIVSLKAKKSFGLDEVPNKVIKDLAEVIFLPLTWLFNAILRSGAIPKSWKISKIRPVYKKGNKDQIANYRPVCITSSFSKVFEKCLVLKLSSLFDLDDMMGPHQNAFRPGHSTITATLTIQDFLSSELDRGRHVLLYSTDLTAAFDLLRPNLMAKILLEKKIPLIYVKIIFDFLTKRKGFVEFEGINSHIFNMDVGCAQGSVLGPFLFNVYTSQLQTIIHNLNPGSFVCSYADDSYVGISFPPDKLNDTIGIAENVIEGHLEWLGGLGMKCNNSKTEVVIFGQNTQRCSLKIDDNVIPINDSIKILGITFEKSLKWSSHVNNVIKKANSFAYSIRQLNKLLPRKLHKTVIHAHFLSHITYGLPVWGGCLSRVETNRLNTLIFKIMRIHCFDFRKRKSNLELCQESQLRNFNSLRILSDTSMLHRLCTDPESSYLTTRLIQQSYFLERTPGRIFFYDNSVKRIGNNSFINRAKKISELIPFPWPDLSYHVFKTRMKLNTPLLVG